MDLGWTPTKSESDALHTFGDLTGSEVRDTLVPKAGVAHSGCRRSDEILHPPKGEVPRGAGTSPATKCIAPLTNYAELRSILGDARDRGEHRGLPVREVRVGYRLGIGLGFGFEPKRNPPDTK